MSTIKKFYRNSAWFEFADKVKARDRYTCLKCQRSNHEVVLQAHHTNYLEGKLPWEYAISDCISLCKGCHAREHGLIEPNTGWSLVSIDDLGDLAGECERANCGTAIRYEHQTYHPNWGYKIVGSTCIEHLTKKDQELSGKILNLYKVISNFVHSEKWVRGNTKNNKPFIDNKYNHHKVRIYGESNNYSFQIAIKENGIRWYDYKDIISVRGHSLEEAKELAFIALKGTLVEDATEKNLFRSLYKNIK